MSWDEDKGLSAKMNNWCCAAHVIGGYSSFYGGDPTVEECKQYITKVLDDHVPAKSGTVTTTVYTKTASADEVEVDGIKWLLDNNWVRAYEELGWTRCGTVKGSYGNYTLVTFALFRNHLLPDNVLAHTGQVNVEAAA